MKYSSDKDLHKHVCERVRQGWRFKRGKKHGKLIPPDGRGIVVVPTSPSSQRATQELAWAIRKLGYS